VHATHRGPLVGIEATGRRVEFTGVFIDRLAAGRPAGHRDEVDRLGLLAQLGGSAPPPGAA
jgi:predicted ester cyclase